MSADYTEYANHFREGKRVRVGIPLSDDDSFQEWGIVRSLDADLLEVELSRDFLPQQARLELGRTLHLGVPDGKEKLCCRGIIAGAGKQRLMLRLVERLMPYEPREFFRQEVYLPLDYRVPPRQEREEIAERWHQSRWAMEFAVQEPEPGERAELAALREEVRTRMERRKAAPPVAANISGGGVRFNMKERLRPGMLVELSVYLPEPRRVIEIVGEVVQVTGESGRGPFGTALRFRFIDEADRDRLIRHICAQQIAQLSQQTLWQERSADQLQAGRKARPLRVLLALLLLVLLLAVQVRSITASRERGEKHEIAVVFERGIFEFLKQRR